MPSASATAIAMAPTPLVTRVRTVRSRMDFCV
jgi:hypothetical protein